MRSAGIAVWGSILIAALGSAAAAGCGGEEEPSGPPPTVALPEHFPRASGKTLAELRSEIGQSGPVLSPSVSQFEPGRNRFGFGLFQPNRAQIQDEPAAVYVAPVGGGPARGPFPARYESLAVKPRFHSRTTASDPDAARSLYVAEPTFPKAGEYEVLGVARLDERLAAATMAGPPLRVVADTPVPEVGERAPRTHTPTASDVGGDLGRIDTRQPPGTMHDVDLAAVLGKRPAMLLFATPALCQSRVCAPVVDIAEQVKAQSGGGTAWIHMEIYRDNEVERGFRPQVLQWRLPTEPWLFAIDRSGRIAARLEGAFSPRELERALRAAQRG